MGKREWKQNRPGADIFAAYCLQLISQKFELWIGLMAENLWHVYIASSLDMKQVLYSIGLFASLSAPAELGLPRSSCICKKGNKSFCCHPPGLPRGKLWVRLNSAVTESLRKALHRGTCLRCSCLCLRRISSDLPGSRDSQGKGNHGVPRGMTEKPQWFLLEAPSGRHLLTMFV